jgi:hypothetical protein
VKRKAELRSSKPLASRTPLRHSSGPKRGSGFRRTPPPGGEPARKPAKVPRDTGPSRKVRKLVLERDDYCCVCCGKSVIGQVYSLQHRDARGSGGTSDPMANSPVNLVTMLGDGLTGCHGRVELREDPADGRKGYRLDAGQDPALTPVWRVNEFGVGRWAWPAHDGTWIYEAPAGASAPGEAA